MRVIGRKKPMLYGQRAWQRVHFFQANRSSILMSRTDIVSMCYSSSIYFYCNGHRFYFIPKHKTIDTNSMDF